MAAIRSAPPNKGSGITSGSSGGGGSNNGNPRRRDPHRARTTQQQQDAARAKNSAFWMVVGFMCLTFVLNSLFALNVLTIDENAAAQNTGDGLAGRGRLGGVGKDERGRRASSLSSSAANDKGQAGGVLAPLDSPHVVEPVWYLGDTEDDFYTRAYDFDNSGGEGLKKLHGHRKLNVKRFFNGMCGHYRFNTSAMPDVSVIVTVQNEQPELLSITVHSVLAKTPPELLKEIIIVDDNGIPPEIRGSAVNETEFEELKSLSPKVIVLQNYAREGCARSRMVGARRATAAVLMFIDSHVEMLSSTWLEHLLLPIIENPHTMALQTLDIMDDRGNHTYNNPGNLLFGSVSERFLFTYQSYRWEGEKYQEGPHRRLPYETPFGPGSLFAIRRDEFWRLGGYDKGLYVWGGENTELAFKMWTCGGRMVMVPCSRVGHMYRIHIKEVGRWPPFIPQNLTDALGLGMKGKWIANGARADNFTKIVSRNNIRIMNVWVGDHVAKRGYYKEVFGSEELPPEWQQFEEQMLTDPAALEQFRIKEENKCHDFDWFDKHVFYRLLGKHHPWHPSRPALISCGRHKAESCAKCPKTRGASYCHGDCRWCENGKKGTCVDAKEFDRLCPAKANGGDSLKKLIANKKQNNKKKKDKGQQELKAFQPEPKVAKLAQDMQNKLHALKEQQHDKKKEEVKNGGEKELTISVVLPCGFEHETYVRTVKSVFEATPEAVHLETIIVDDASDPPLEPGFPDAADYRARVVRNEKPMGLIGAKYVGAMAAKGDIVVFFDCHVKPAENYWVPFVNNIKENYKRVVIPTITSLNVDTWEEFNRPSPGSGGGMSKCYLTFDGQFKWTTDDTPYVPIMSGGLLAMSRRWFLETGGYDTTMKGWGGENLDQSLRIWRCGGEIVAAPESYVAHMWRDAKHQAKYKVNPGDPALNRARAMRAHTGPWFDKTLTFPAFDQFVGSKGMARVNVDSITDTFKGKTCESFQWYLNRFSYIYRDAGVLPVEIFQIESMAAKGEDEGAEEKKSLCLQLEDHEEWDNAGDPNDSLVLAPCEVVSDANSISEGTQWFHGSNRREEDGDCCSGLRVWNTDQCIDGLNTNVCPLTSDMKAEITMEGLLKVNDICISVDPDGVSLTEESCDKATRWLKRGNLRPMEFQLLDSTMQGDWMKHYHH